jgi:class 3 adenylate cyclase/tetratricopeptide (TPR) repeat protein
LEQERKLTDSPAEALPSGDTALGEALARKAHENWCKLRLAQGWRYGRQSDDSRKEHPGLVPFEELPESEKEHHRKIAMETLNTLRELGYNLQAPLAPASDATPHGSVVMPIAAPMAAAPVAPDVPEHLLQRLGDLSLQDRAALQLLWSQHDAGVWSGNVEIYRTVAQKILKLGEPLFAYDVAAEGIKIFAQDVRLRQLLALALARSGAVATANEVLTALSNEGHADEETLGLLARTHKDLAVEARDPAEKTRHFREAYKFYLQAYQSSGGYWSGINAATMALLLGDREQSVSLAGKVALQCRAEAVVEQSGDLYWLFSTLGEAALLRKNWQEAEDWYSKAVELEHGNWGNLQSTRHNARLLLHQLQGDEKLVERIFCVPSVVSFTGHMVDRPGREIPRFPVQLEQEVKTAIRERLEKLNAGFGYASAACGSDILFHEAMLERHCESHVVLPYEKDLFLQDSVGIAGDPGWLTRCNRVMSLAAEVQEVSKRSRICGQVSYTFGNLMFHGLASVHAAQLETKLVPMAVWDGQAGDGPDGTAAMVERWRAQGLEVEIIDLQQILRRQCPELVVETKSASEAVAHRAPHAAAICHPGDASQPEFSSEIRALLFADAQGFSELSDEQVPLFVHHFLGLAGQLAAHSSHQPLMKNTWGDGLYFVFASVQDAGQFALDLRDGVCSTDWEAKGLPSLNLRIGLHAGPVYACTDPVTLRPNYIGAHVSRAARIEPITPTGQVYASQSFAALAAAEGVKVFRCDYVGRTPMAKKYGVFPTYVVHRSIARNGNRE